MQRVVKLVSMIIIAFTAIVMVGCDAKIESLESVATIENSELKGDSKNCAVILPFRLLMVATGLDSLMAQHTLRGRWRPTPR